MLCFGRTESRLGEHYLGVADRDVVLGLIKRDPPARAIEWARKAIGPSARVVSVGALTGGTSHGNHAIVMETATTDVEVVLRRWVRPDWEISDPEYSAAREAANYGLLDGTSVAAPRILAADTDAWECDVPALLLTRARGRRVTSEELIRSPQPLAEAIYSLHSSVVSDAARSLLPYSPFTEPSEVAAPAWSANRDAWHRAVELAAVPIPDAAVFIHRDFHQGNTLWTGESVSAIVDWTTASWGPPSVDLCHMRVNLVLAAGLDTADAFADAYRSVAGSDRLNPLWDLKMAVDFIPDFRADGASTPELRRLDEFVLTALSGL